MSENRFKIVFDGALLPGVDITTAKLNLAELFKSDVAAIERLFSGQTGSAQTRPVARRRADLPPGADENRHRCPDRSRAVHRAEPGRRSRARSRQQPTRASADAESPYAPPQASCRRSAAGSSATLKAFSFEGRIGRLRYLAWTMVLTLVLMGVGRRVRLRHRPVAHRPDFDRRPDHRRPGRHCILCIAFVVVSIQISVQRLHDIGWSGWLWLLNLVPFVGSFFPFLIMVVPGNTVANRYGAPPPPNSTAVKVLSSLWAGVHRRSYSSAHWPAAISAIQQEYENTAESSYESGSVTTDEVEVEPAEEAEQVPNSADDEAEEAPAPVDSAKE